MQLNKQTYTPFRKFGAVLLLLLLVLPALAQQNLPTRTTIPNNSQPDINALVYGDVVDNFTRGGDSGTALRSVIDRNGQVPVVVTFRTTTRNSALDDATRSLSVRATTQRLLSDARLARAQNVKTFENFPIMALTVDADGLAALEASPEVASIALDLFREKSLDESTVEIGAGGSGGMWESGYTGQGQVVAVLDTGFDLDHPMLSGKFVKEACYSTNGIISGIPVSSLCQGGVTEATGAGSAEACNFADGDCGHGTHVAGIVAGNGAYKGVAYNANLIGIQVFSMVTSNQICVNDDGSPKPSGTCSYALDSDILKGMDYVYSQRNNYNIAAVNLSLGGSPKSSEQACVNDTANQAYIPIVTQLKNVGIATIAASGNNSYTTLIDGPACLPDVISVAATGNQDTPNSIWLFSNTAPFLDFVAPGFKIRSAEQNGDTVNQTGTSMATPHVAGAYALLRSYKGGLSLSQIHEALTLTANVIVDPYGSYRFIQVDGARQYLLEPEKPTLIKPANGANFNAPSVTFEWTAGADTTKYIVIIKDNKGNTVLKLKKNHADCGATCTITHNGPFPDNKTFTWKVKARNDNQKTNSDKWSFSVNYPGATSVTSPADGVQIQSPSQLGAFKWAQVSGASEYILIVKDTKAGKKAFKAKLTNTACSGGQCSYTMSGADMASLKGNRRYKWLIKTKNQFGKSKSERRNFFTVAPGKPVLQSPADGIVYNDPSQLTTMTWTSVPYVNSYQIVLRIAANKNVKFKQKINVGSGINCSAGVCTLTVPQAMRNALQDGKTYQWKVKAISQFGKGKSGWFKLVTQFPGKPFNIAPADGVTITNYATQMPNLQWKQIPYATEYKVIIKNKANGSAFYKSKHQPGVGPLTCGSGTCTLNGNAFYSSLKNNKNYIWKVKAISPYGKDGSKKFTFKLRLP